MDQELKRFSLTGRINIMFYWNAWESFVERILITDLILGQLIKIHLATVSEFSALESIKSCRYY